MGKHYCIYWQTCITVYDKFKNYNKWEVDWDRGFIFRMNGNFNVRDIFRQKMLYSSQ